MRLRLENLLLTTFAAATLFACSPQIHANTLFSDFAPGYGYNPNAGQAVTGGTPPNSPANLSLSERFTATGSGQVDFLTVAAFTYFSPPATGDFFAELYTNTGINSGAPGLLIDTFVLTAPAENFVTPGAPTMAASTNHSSLTAGSDYWLTFRAASASTVIELHKNSTGQENYLYAGQDGTLYLQYGLNTAFELSNTVPEPGSFALFASGGIGFAIGALRRRSPGKGVMHEWRCRERL